MHWIRHHEFEVVRELGQIAAETRSIQCAVGHTHRGRAARGRPCPGFGITTEFHAICLPEDRRRSEQAIMKVRDAIKRIESDGWRLSRTRGSNRQYHIPPNRGR